MRTVDPELWSSRVKGRRLALARPFRFGKKAGREAWLRDSLGDAMMEFVRTCSVGGVRRLVSPHTGRWERYRWMIFLLLALIFGLLVSSLELIAFVEQPPLHVSLQTTQHKIKEIPFPAVAICSYNVISEENLKRVVSHLFARDVKRQYTQKELRKNLLSFGSLLTMSLPPLDLEFMPFVTGEGAGYRFNVSQLMQLLAPTCESMLLRCSWRGMITPCDRLFALRITSVGFCCVFNSRYDPEDYYTPPKVLDMVGVTNGLSVILKDDQEDVAFLRKPNLGYEILIFDGSEYPMLESGAVRVAATWPNASVYCAISTRQQVASPALAYYSEAWRGCRLRQPGGAPHRRSYGWCLLDCRRRATLQLCGCVPYTLLPRHDELICSLNQLNCLNKHREKFLYYYPFGSSTDALSEESQDALYCEDCRADCARAPHSTTLSLVKVPRRMLDKLIKSQFMSGLRTSHNISVLHLLYLSEELLLYEVEANNNWYENLGSMMSQWAVLVGLPLAAVLELVFHCTVRWRHHYVRRRAISRL